MSSLLSKNNTLWSGRLEFPKDDYATVTYTNKLVFTKAETTPEEDDTQKWQLLTPTTFREIGSSQQTMLVDKKDEYEFTPPTKLPYDLTMVTNGTGSVIPETVVDIAFGFFEDRDSQTPTQVLYFDGVPKSRPLSLDFKPVLTACFVPKNYYVPSQILTLPIPSPVALQVDIRMVSDQTTYIISASESGGATIDLVQN